MRILKTLLILGLLAIGASGGTWIYINGQIETPVGDEKSEEEIFEVPKGSTLNAIGHKLEAKGFIRNVFFWKVYLKQHPKQDVKAGRHIIRKAMNIPELLAALSATPISEDVPLTMVEGWRLRDADEWLAKNGWIEAGEYIAACKNLSAFSIPFSIEEDTLEGYLLPETYMVPKGTLDVKKLIQRQLNAFHKRFYIPNQNEIKASKRSLRDIVVMASMLEREEPKPAVRPMVAGVLYKRLDAKTPLGVDATSRYSLEDWSNRRTFLKQLRNPEDPYNTRLKVGLPPTAIGAPSIPSLLAALRPKENPYWYYLHDSQQNIHYGRNAAEHEANRKKYNVY